MLEHIYSRLFAEKSPEIEWRLWHERTRAEIDRLMRSGEQPKELVDATELKYYSWLSEEVQHLMGEHQNRVKKILEVGSGSGALSRKLSESLNAEYTLLDNEKIAIEYASLVNKGSDSHVKLIQGDATALPLEDNEFDLVHSVGLIEHFSDDVILQMISEMRRVTKEKGFVYLAVPNYFSPDLLSIWHKYGKGSERYIPKSSLGKYMRKVGFKSVYLGHSGFTVNANYGRFLPAPIEKLIGKMGLGFLNYAFGIK